MKRMQSRTMVGTAAVAAMAVSMCSSRRVGVSAFAPQHLESSVVVPTANGLRGAAANRRVRHGSICVLRMSSTIEKETTESQGEMDESSIATPLREEFDNNVKQAKASSRGFGGIIKEKMGTVDESRLVFPEFSSGDVPRLYSNIDYKTCEEGIVTSVSHAAGSTVGAAAVIASTTIGAGALALPAATAPAGYLPSSAGLLLAGVYTAISGLLIAELTINRIGETGRTDIGLIDLYKNSLGEKWGAIGTGAFFFLQYAVMIACVAQGGMNLDSFLKASGVESVTTFPGFGQVAFAATIGVSLLVAQSSAVEKVNKALLFGAGATFLGIVGVGAGTADFGALVAMDNQHPEVLVDAFPILFLSLAHQSIVPTVVQQLEGDTKKITKAIVGGTAVPFLMYLAWNAIILGNVASAPWAFAGDMDPFALLQFGDHGGRTLSALVGGFSELAVVTSLVRFIYTTTDAMREVAGLPNDGPRYEGWKPALFAAAIIPPILLSVGDPDVFFKALDFGGAFGVSTLFLVLPAVMVWEQRYGEEQTPLTTKPMVPFGKIPLGSLWKAAATLIVEQGADKLGLIDFVKDTFDLL